MLSSLSDPPSYSDLNLAGVVPAACRTVWVNGISHDVLEIVVLPNEDVPLVRVAVPGVVFEGDSVCALDDDERPVADIADTGAGSGGSVWDRDDALER